MERPPSGLEDFQNRQRPPSGLEDFQSRQFWNEFMRRPDAKAAYAAERRLQEKKKKWLAERQAIEERGEHRRKVADALEDAPVELKKLIAPIFHIRIVEEFLWDVLDECQREKKRDPKDFHQRLHDARYMDRLLELRSNFQEGGEARMEDIEKEWKFIGDKIAKLENEKVKELPQPIDVHTLKDVLEYAQECKREGNLKFKEGLYEEALHIYNQGDEVMKKWKVDGHMKNEKKWLGEYHLACLKNKAQAAIKLELFQTALDAADAALALDNEDHKAWYRKLQAEKGLGKFKDAEESLAKLEDVAQWCPDRRRILRDCDAERKRLKVAIAKHKQGTKDMLGKALESGIFSGNREKELEDAAAPAEVPKPVTAPPPQEQRRLEEGRKAPSALEKPKPLERKIYLTPALAGDLIDELADAYAQKSFQERVRKCARDSGFERSVFLMRLKDLAFDVQKPVLVKWGFDGDETGVREMTAAIRDHSRDGKEMPPELKKKHDKCLALLYGGKEGGMLEILMP